MVPKLASSLVALALCASLALTSGAHARPTRAKFEPHVVVATLDTGTNPFHPTWQRNEYRHPSAYIPGYPKTAASLDLTITDSFKESVAASKEELDGLKGAEFPVWVPGTNLIGLWAGADDMRPVFDVRNPTDTGSHSHGAHASSQISGEGFGLSPDSYLVVMDRTSDGGRSPYEVNAEGLRWAADQPWIDIIHTNIQNPVPLADEETLLFPGYPEAVRYALSKGKVVVSAGGNFWVEPTETSPHAGPPGVLVAGANDNCGYTDYANPDPHVVMDGYQTYSAAADSYEQDTFGGTSSASPRTTGYVAELLLRIRREYGYTGGIRNGALVTLPPATRPATGPLADGRLVAAEMHEIVRKTANPNPHESKWDGDQMIGLCVPQPVDLPVAFYPKMGYGEISEHTIDLAFDVAVGRAEMPSRPVEDEYYKHSEELRRRFWE